MLESQFWEEFYAQLPQQFTYEQEEVTINIYRAKQSIKKIDYPALFVSFLDPIEDKTHTPLNKILEIYLKEVEGETLDQIAYTKGIVVQQSIDLLLYDLEIKRIAVFETDLWLWLNQNLADVSYAYNQNADTITDVSIFKIYPPRNLDFTEADYIYKRNIEIVTKYAMSWELLVTTIETVEASLGLTPA